MVIIFPIYLNYHTMFISKYTIQAKDTASIKFDLLLKKFVTR